MSLAHFFRIPQFLLLFALAGCGEQNCGQESHPLQSTLERSIHINGAQVAKEQELQLLSIANVTNRENTQYRLAFSCKKGLCVDTARRMGVYAVKRFVELMEESNEPINLDAIELKIHFVDKKNKPIAQPYVAQLVFNDAQFYYYKVDSTTKNKRLALRESFTDALRQSANNTKSRTFYY